MYTKTSRRGGHFIRLPEKDPFYPTAGEGSILFDVVIMNTK